MISIPFMASGTPDVALRHCLLLLGLNLIYLLRAKTEEWHLAQDPDYAAYALWMEQHGMFRWVRYIPVLRYAVKSWIPAEGDVIKSDGICSQDM